MVRLITRYTLAVKEIANKEWLIWDDFADFYVWTDGVCKTTRQYLSKLLEDKDEEIYEIYKNYREEEKNILKENGIKCFSMYVEPDIRKFYKLEKDTF